MKPTLTWIRWLDAQSHEAADDPEAKPELAELCEVGFLLAETDTVVLIGMEQSENAAPGRWRLHIPKTAIVERRDVTVERAFRKPRQRKPKVDKKADAQTPKEPKA